MSKPKISVLIDWYLPGTKAGGPVRSIYSLVNLLKNYFDFYIITTNCDLGAKETYKEVASNTLFAEEGVHYYYFSNDKLSSKSIVNLLEIIKPDLIYLNSFWSLNFSISIVRLKKLQKIKTPVLLAPRGMLGKGALGLKSFKKQIFLSFSRLLGWYGPVSFHATQLQEQSDILAKFSKAKVMIAPNVNSGKVIQNTSEKVAGSLRLFYLSRIAKIKNLHFALEVLKEIPLECEVVYDLFGNLEDIEYWNDCKTIIEQLPKNITVRYMREIQFNEVQSVIGNYHCLFLPTLNENFGHSIVESLLCGCPVIISDQTPWNDLEENGAGFALDLTNKQKFIDSIVSCVNLNQEAFSTKSQKAINYISKKIDLDLITSQYKTLFNESIKN